MNYGCTVGGSNPTQVELVREQCRNSNACRIEANREFFGNSVCPGTDDAQMTLSMSYTCNMAGRDKSSAHIPTCNPGSDNDTTTAPVVTTAPDNTTAPVITTAPNTCAGNEGEVEQVDVPGCGEYHI